MGLSAIPRTIALFSMLQDILIIKAEEGLEAGSPLSRLIAKHGIHRRRIHYLTWIENMRGIPGIFYFLQQSIILRSDHFLDELSA